MLKSRSGDKIISGMNILHNNSDQLFSFLCDNRRVESANLNLNDNKWNFNSVKNFSTSLFQKEETIRGWQKAIVHHIHCPQTFVCSTFGRIVMN